MSIFYKSGILKIHPGQSFIIPDDTSQASEIVEFREIKKYLHLPIKFAENVNISTLIDIVLTDIDFYSYVVGVDLNEFCLGLNFPIEQVSICESIFGDKIKNIEVFWEADSYISTDDRELEIQPKIHGRGELPDVIDLGVLPAADYITLPISIVEDVEVFSTDFRDEGKYDVRSFELGKQKFTLLDILRAIFFDLSFFGMPGSKEKEEYRNELVIVEKQAEEDDESYPDNEFGFEVGPEEDYDA